MWKNTFRSKTKRQIEVIGYDVQSLLNEEFQRDVNRENNNTALEQTGLRDGKSIIDEYLANLEYGLAIDHLLYMIHETDISISKSTSTLLYELSEKMNFSIDHIKHQLKE